MFTTQDAPTTNLLIADDHQLVREMVRDFIGAQPDFMASAVGSFHDAYRSLTDNSPFDVLLLDVQMPGMEGIRSVETLVRDFSDTSVVVFSGVATDHYINEALEVGARGFIPKTLPFKSLLNAIRLINSGEVFVPSSFTTDPTKNEYVEKHGLSRHELSVLRMVCAGLSNKEIAREMAITEVLVKMHMRSICKRMDAKNRTEAAVIALREKII